MEGVTIGQYRVTGLIGQGGMGAVYAGEHTLLGRPAAIKVLLPELSQKQDVVMRFFNEAKAATAIRHPGIVEIYDFGWTPEGAAFIVMERLDGESLGDRLTRGRFRWPAAFAIARQIAGALAAAHAKGIVHRDLKPDNIFVVSDPEVPGGERIKLLDFGIAKLANDNTQTVNVTRTGAVMGTPTYMAPEQCRGVAVDHRADLYALGCILFELCSGRPPFVGEGSGDVLAAHIHVPVPALSTLGVELPRPVEDVIRGLLAKAPAQRPANAEALIQAIDGVGGAERARTSTGQISDSRRARTVAATPNDITTLSGTANSKVSMPAAGSRRRWIALISGAAVAGVIGVVIVTSKHGSEPARVPYGELHTEPAKAPEAAPAPVAAAVAPVAAAVVPAPAAAPVVTPPVATTPPPEPAPAPTPATPPPVAAPVEQAIDIDSSPSGAQVTLGGQPLGKTPLHTTVKRATNAQVVIHLAGYIDQTLKFRAGQPLKDSANLKPVPSKPKHDPSDDRNKSVNPFGN